MWAGHQIGGIPGREDISVQWALEGLDVHDLTTEHAWPYGRPTWQHGRPHEARDPANRASVPEWRRAAPCDFGTVADSATDGKPVILTLRLVPAACYTDGPVDAPAGLRTFGSHAVLVVGTQAKSLVVKNSWGDGWQTGGYGLVTREYVDAYGVVAHTLFGA